MLEDKPLMGKGVTRSRVGVFDHRHDLTFLSIVTSTGY